MEFQDFLERRKGCATARVWAGNMTIEEVVATCQRGEWLLWLADRIGFDRRPLALTKGHCANTVRHLMRDERSINAVDAAIAYGNGDIDIDILNILRMKAATASFEASIEDCSLEDTRVRAMNLSFARAANSALNCCTFYGNSWLTAKSAADACGLEGSKEYVQNQLATANIVREHLGELIIQKVNAILNEPK